MIFSFLTEDNIYTKYEASEVYTTALTKPFPEFDRIARNRPHEGIDPAYPKTTDGTTASIIRKTPRRIIQQIPTGTVVSEDNGWLGIVAEYIFTEQIIPQATEDYSLIQKAWTVIEKGLTFGSCMTYTPFINHDGKFSPDLSIPYWGDVFLQKGKKSGYSCSYIFMRSWWQPDDIKSLIDSETKLIAQSKKSKTNYQPTWDIGALQQVIDNETAKDARASTPDDKERGIEASGVELITGFQKGKGAVFLTFSPSAKVIVRRKINKDPRGKMPIDWMYGDIDGTNPLGRGIVELVGGLQNLIDSDMQMYQFNRALALAPPVLQFGNMKSFKYAPNVVVKTTDPNAHITPIVVDTSAIANYPSLYGMQKSQLLNLVNSPDTSVSSEVGNPGFGKTPAALQQQQTVISVDDNYVDKMFETWFQSWGEGTINMYFAEHSGIEELQLNKETAMRLRELEGFDQTMLSPDNKIMINYDTATPALKFRVNPSTSKKKDNAEQTSNASNLLDMVMKYPMLNSNYGGPIDIEVLARRIVVNSGIDDPEQVAPEPTEAQKQSKEQQKNTVSPFSPMFDKPTIRMNYPDLPMAAQIQVLANAGVHVSPQDMMQGPVVDPNMRGVMVPQSDPNALMPGGQLGQPNGPQTPQQAPIDLGDIYKGTTDPAVKAQIEKMAGLQPDQANVEDNIATNMATHAASQANSVGSIMPQPPQQPVQQPTQQPQEEQQEQGQPMNVPQESAELSPEDQQIIRHLQALGLPPHVIQQAIQMAEQNVPAAQILQAIGVSNG